jgi:hypothetical protein
MPAAAAGFRQVARAANASWCTHPKGSDARVPTSYSRSLTKGSFVWRDVLSALYPLLLAAGLALDEGSHDVYQFGVMGGNSLIMLRKQVFRTARFYGFDTFSGIPASKDEVQLAEWSEGAFKVTPHLVLRHIYRDTNGGRGSFMVRGRFDQTLTPSLARDKGMKPAVYVDMDADLYDSSILSLHWLFRNGLIVPGTLVGYDDWWVIPCAAHAATPKAGATRSAPQSTGEWRAHLEATLAYNVTWRCVAGPCALPADGVAGLGHCDLHSSIGPIFRVESWGAASTPDSGFAIGSSKVAWMLNHWEPCLDFQRVHHIK